MSTAKDRLRRALVRLKEATSTGADVDNFRSHLDRVDRPDFSAANVLVSGSGDRAFDLLDNDIARDTLLAQTSHGTRQVRLATSGDASNWFLAESLLSDAIVFHEGKTVDGESAVWFLAPRSKGDEARVYVTTYTYVRALEATLPEAIEAEVERLLAVGPQSVQWNMPTARELARLSTFRDLDALGIGGGAVDDAVVDQIVALPRLRALELRHVEGLTPERLERLKAHPTLRSLRHQRKELLLAIDEASPFTNRWGSVEVKPGKGAAGLFVGRYIPAAGQSYAPALSAERLRFVQATVASFPGVIATSVGGVEEQGAEKWPVAIGVPVATSAKTAKVAASAIAEAKARCADLPAELWQVLAAATGVRALRREPLELFLTINGQCKDNGGHAATFSSPRNSALTWEVTAKEGLTRIGTLEGSPELDLSCKKQKW